MKFNIIESENGYGVIGGTKEVLTPEKNPVILPNYFMAQEVIQELQAKLADNKKPFFLIPIVNTAIDQGQKQKQKWIDNCLFYLNHDALLHWVDESHDLQAEQSLKWLPIIDLVQKEIGCEFKISKTISVAKQDKLILDFFDNYLNKLTPIELILFSELSAILHSFLLSFVYFEHNFVSNELFDIAYLEEIFQMNQWGITEEQQERHEYLKQMIKKLCQYNDSLT